MALGLGCQTQPARRSHNLWVISSLSGQLWSRISKLDIQKGDIQEKEEYKNALKENEEPKKEKESLEEQLEAIGCF